MTEEILNGKLQFWCSKIYWLFENSPYWVAQNKFTGWNINWDPIRGGKGGVYDIWSCRNLLLPLNHILLQKRWQLKVMKKFFLGRFTESLKSHFSFANISRKILTSDHNWIQIRSSYRFDCVWFLYSLYLRSFDAWEEQRYLKV